MLNKELLMAGGGGLPPTLVVRVVKGTSGHVWYSLTTGEDIEVFSSVSKDGYSENLISEIDLNSTIYIRWFEDDTKLTTVNTDHDSTARDLMEERAPSLMTAHLRIQDPTKDAFITLEPL